MTQPDYRALVVDDEVMIRQLVIRSLAEHGFICDGASNGLEAKTLAEAVKYDAVITDLRMPECHGHQLAVDLLAEQNPPVLVIHTGVMEPRLARDLMARGVDDILFKPVDGDVLAVKVMTLIDRRRSREAKKSAESVAKAVPCDQLSENDAAIPTAASVADAQQRKVQTFSQNVTPVSLIELRAKSAHVKQVLPISQTAMDVFEMANAGSYDADQIADAITRDASLVVEVLRLANSSLYNRSSEKITGLEDAVALLGQKRVGEMAVATNALGALTAGALPWMDVPLAWQRSVAAGMAIESLISQGSHRRIECGLMICGIMHNLGRVVLGTLYPAKYVSMVERCEHLERTLLEEETAVFPTSHTEFLANLLSQWNVPADIRHPLKFLLEPYSSLAAIPETTRTKARLIKAAVAISQAVVGRWEAWEAIEFPSEDLLMSLGIRDMPAIIERTRDGLEEVLASSPKGASNSVKSPTKARQLAYIDLSGASFDFLRGVVSSTETELVEFPVDAGESEEGVLVNCLGVPPREFSARLATRPQGQVLIVTDSSFAQQYRQFGEVLSHPHSYSVLRSACWKAAREITVEAAKEERCNALA
jgi:HD-like signal output (HDOD) protein/DNA-binding NarL/FixJ family response regulator